MASLSVALASDVEDNHIDRSWFSHRVNLPNYITLTRIAAIPLLIWILCTPRFSNEQTGEREILASAVFILASITDGIDGYLARKRGQITTMGMLLDPLADKLLIAAAFITLVQVNPALVPAWMAVVIIGREFLVSGLRTIAASEGFTIQASELGKFKMLVQIISVVAVIRARLLRCLLGADRPQIGKASSPGLRPRPAEKTRCPGCLKHRLKRRLRI